MRRLNIQVSGVFLRIRNKELYIYIQSGFLEAKRLSWNLCYNVMLHSFIVTINPLVKSIHGFIVRIVNNMNVLYFCTIEDKHD